MELCNRLRGLREDADMTQSALANKLNLKPSAVSKYEMGLTQPSLATLIQLAGIFNVSVDYLLGLSNVKNYPNAKEAFTPKEAEIVVRYRKLNKENQIRLDERISAMLDGQRKNA